MSDATKVDVYSNGEFAVLRITVNDETHLIDGNSRDDDLFYLSEPRDIETRVAEIEEDPSWHTLASFIDNTGSTVSESLALAIEAERHYSKQDNHGGSTARARAFVGVDALVTSLRSGETPDGVQFLPVVSWGPGYSLKVRIGHEPYKP